MNNSKSILMKAGKTKSSTPAVHGRWAELKQQIKDAKLHLQSAKRAVSEAKDSLKRAKQAHKMEKKATGVRHSPDTPIAKPVVKPKAPATKPAAKRAVPKQSMEKTAKTKSTKSAKRQKKSASSGPAKTVMPKAEVVSKPAERSAPAPKPRKRPTKTVAAVTRMSESSDTHMQTANTAIES